MSIWKKRPVGGYPARKVAPDDQSSPTLTGGEKSSFYKGDHSDLEHPAYGVSKAIGEMIDNERGVTDYSTAKDMMDVNVRDYVKAVHSENPPVTIDAKYGKKGSNYKAGQSVPAIEESLYKEDDLG